MKTFNIYLGGRGVPSRTTHTKSTHTHRYSDCCSASPIAHWLAACVVWCLAQATTPPRLNSFSLRWLPDELPRSRCLCIWIMNGSHLCAWQPQLSRGTLLPLYPCQSCQWLPDLSLRKLSLRYLPIFPVILHDPRVKITHSYAPDITFHSAQ